MTLMMVLRQHGNLPVTVSHTDMQSVDVCVMPV